MTTPTPLTDAAAQPRGEGWECDVVDVAFARDLERELILVREANASLARWKGEIDSHLIAAGVEFPENYNNSPKWAIDQLQKCALSEVPAMRWIPVEERMPKPEQAVLGYWPKSYYYSGGSETVKFYPADAPDSSDAWIDGHGEAIDAPTHWMPNPETPK